MSLNHEGHNSTRRENYFNGSIDDFTDCIDFTNQYQKSCSVGENETESAYQSSDSSNSDRDCYTSEIKRSDYNGARQNAKTKKKKSASNEDNSDLHLSSPQNSSTDNENESQPVESDVSLTVGASNLEKQTNNINKGVKDSRVLEKKGNESVKSKVDKEKSVYGENKNHLKLPINKNIKRKKQSVLKPKNGKQPNENDETRQYPRLQPNIKFKCYKCSRSDFSSIAELQAHQRKCISNSQEFDLIHESTSFSSTSNSNSKLTRKVFLCSACGTYYENWNLFLHMKEVHDRHICLYCLGMFSQPDKLAQHLIIKHNVVEQNISSTEDFFQLYRGTCYLICCSCEAMFTEQEELNQHSCTSIPEERERCPLCGLQGEHHPNCGRSERFDDETVQSPEMKTDKSHTAVEKRFYNKKKRLRTNKRSKNVFKIVNNENGGEMSVTVRKQHNPVEETAGDGRGNGYGTTNASESSVTSPLRLPTEDLVSAKQYNEKMLQLYRPNKPTEKVISSIQSIEESINRVVENLGYNEDDDEGSEGGDGDFEDNNAAEDHNVAANGIARPVAENVKARTEKALKARHKETGLSVNAGKATARKEDQSSGFAENLESSGLSMKKDKQVLSDNDSTDSEKLTIAFDQPCESATDKNEIAEKDETSEKYEDAVVSAGPDTPYVYVDLKEECKDEKALIKELVKESSWNCVYCAHAKRIAVNGKQLSLHMLAEHRFVTCSEEATEEDKSNSALNIVERLKNNLVRLGQCYFNTDTFDSEDKSFWKPNDKIYECFHCLFATYVHKELYSHNRKMHQKAVFLCIMCKSNFYNYSELLCHLCPGIYIPGQVINPDITYRCFLCNVDPLPSSFRLMVHLRRRHNSCDICFDQSSNQFQLSTHVWKHKLSHMCYRCGIAYRNKPDITKHLFWKHGTESVLCKKCLQKKWPHVYHFCVPPNSFICDECSFSLKSAVALKVHKRIHTGENPYSCDKCEEKFISRKLLAKHADKHNQEQLQAQAPAPPETEEKEEPAAENAKQEDVEVNGIQSEKKQDKERKSKKRKVLTDVFDLPPVNLSESDDSDQDIVSEPKIVKEKTPEQEEVPVSNGFLNGELQKEDPAATQIVDGVWNNFKNYMDRKEYPKTFRPGSPFKNMSLSRIKAIMLSDHDYHIIPTPNEQETNLKNEAEKAEKAKVGLDHDYCNNNNNAGSKSSAKSKVKSRHKEEGSKSSSSESSSDSDSSCSCGSNCSCSSGSSSSSSSNDSDSDSREKRKEKKKVSKEAKAASKAEPEPTPEIEVSVHDVSNENTIRESDLETEETETDEDFYDYNPAREANRILAEKRTQLLANLNGSDTFASSPSTPTEKAQTPKKKSKIKKKRSQSRTIPKPKTNRKKSKIPMAFGNNIPGANGSGIGNNVNANGVFDSTNRTEDGVRNYNEGDAKRPKRKRVPLKFYGFSSDEESETTVASRKREKSEHNTTTPAPQIASNPVLNVKSESNAWSHKSSLSWKVEKSDSSHPKVNPIKIRTSQAVKQNTHFASTDATNNEFFHVRKPEKNAAVHGNGNNAVSVAAGATANPATGQKGEKLYCFCQCPYDEVSEMIACDAEDCVIEWFHFECVGIMVPPKGSWYCPDCRKKLAAENEFLTPPMNEQNAN